MKPVWIIGAGPAGASAALSCIKEGRAVDVVDRSRFPRHKVCGEFFSPEIAPILDRLGVWSRFLSHEPAVIRRMSLHFGNRGKTSPLPEHAWGLSRFAYDRLLNESLTVRIGIGRVGHGPVVDATGRSAGFRIAKGNRTFGFKAHFAGPADDCVELYFFQGFYVGLNCVEGGVTNVCGLGPENLLRDKDFDIDALISTCDPLNRRLAPLTRVMKWMTVGPLLFQNQFDNDPPPLTYPAGDALSFVDPFTGSGLLSAAITGELAGRCAARGVPSSEYISECRRALSRPFTAASLLRNLAGTKVAEYAAALIPGELLYRVTRPRL